MKTKWIWIPMLALVLGCTRETENDVTRIEGEFTLYAHSGDSQTKTILQQDGTVFWSPGDCINVFYGNLSGKFASDNTEPADYAEFTGMLGSFTLDGKTEFVAAYPYSEETSLSDGTLHVNLPAEQMAVEGSFADDLFISVAKSKDENLYFYNVCGGVKFSLAKEGIKKVVFKGNAGESLAGRLAVGFSDEKPQVSGIDDGKTSVTLTVPDGGTFKVGAFYYFVLAPQALQEGYTMEFYSDVPEGSVSSNSPVTIRRSAWGGLRDLVPESPYTVIVPEAVDLGLSVKWASFNLGASTPEEYGDYFSWGETEPKETYTIETYKWCDGADNTYTKYCTKPEFGLNGFQDGKISLDPEDDAAFVHLGGKWRMPTKDDVIELIENCQGEWTTRNGVNGWVFTASNGNSIFLPASNWGSNGRYWTSSLYTDWPEDAYMLYFKRSSYKTYADCLSDIRYARLTIRPVYEVEPTTTVTTYTPTNIGPCSAEVPFSISTPDTVYEYGIIYSTDVREPVMGYLGDGSYVGLYSSEVGSSRIIDELKPNTTYYARAFVILGGERGRTWYGNTVQFTTKDISYSSDFVDIGLSVAWATCNLGSSTPSNVGGYYRWGETELSSSNKGYIWSGADGFTRYNATDGKITLEASDDAASVHLGENWRMPTYDELMELRTNCVWTPATQNGVKGCTITGPNGKSIFVPISEGTSGEFSAEFLSSSLSTYSNDAYRYVHALSYRYDDNVVYSLRTFRDWGKPIRPVYTEPASSDVFEVTPTEVIVGSEGGEFSVDVTTNIGYRITSTPAWVQELTAGEDTRSHRFRVAANESGESRSGIIVFCNDHDLCVPVTVKQGGNDTHAFNWDRAFYHRSLILRFTATWCGYCPTMAHSLAAAHEKYPDRFVSVDVHGNGSNLEFNGHGPLSDLFLVTGYPSSYMDFRRTISNYEPTYYCYFFNRYLQEQEENYPAVTTAALESSLSGDNLNVDVTLYVKEEGDYKVAVYLTESGIVGFQSDHTDGDKDDYQHDDVVRLSLTSVLGDDFSVVSANTRLKRSYSVTIPSKYDRNKLKLLVYIQRAYGSMTRLQDDSYGDYYVDNCVYAEVGRSVPPAVVGGSGAGNEDVTDGKPVNW